MKYFPQKRFANIIAMSLILAYIFTSCESSNEPTPPVPKPPGYQEDIPWPSLADSPWPINQGNPQYTARAKVSGPSSGNIEWTFDAKHGMLNGPVIDKNSNIYFGTDPHLQDYFYSLNTKTKELNWESKTNKGRRIASNAIVTNNSKIYAHDWENVYCFNSMGGIDWTWQAPDGLNLYTMNVNKMGEIYISSFLLPHLYIIGTDGVLKHQIEFQDKLRRGISFSPSGEQMYVCTEGEKLLSLDKYGSVIREHQYEKIYHPVVLDSDGNIYIIQRSDSVSVKKLTSEGALIWEHAFYYSSHYWNKFGHANPTLDKFGNFTFYGYDEVVNKIAITQLNYMGNLNWKYFLEDEGVSIQAQIVSDLEGKIYFGDTFGQYFYCLTSGGDLLWKLPLDGLQIDGAPAFSEEGVLFIGGHRPDQSSMTKTILAIK